MDLLNNLALGFSTVLSLDPVSFPLIGTIPFPTNIVLCFIGCLVGTLIGVLPGVGPIATIAMLLPITFNVRSGRRAHHARRHLLRRAVRRLHDRDPRQYPGRGDIGRHRLDGHQMARQGRAGVALGIAAIGSFFAGCVATVLIAAFGGAARRKSRCMFGPAEYFSLMVMGLVFAVVLARGSLLKAFAMILSESCSRPSARTWRPARSA